MRVIGLTGGVASGKSTVASMLRDLGAEVIDADQIARIVVEPGLPAFEEIVEAFGREVLAADGRLDRGGLARVVFSDPEARRRLEGITHPRIIQESERRLEELRRRGVPVVVYEAALLVETGRYRSLDALIVVVAEETEQVRRILVRDGIDAEQARARIAAQLSNAERIAAAQHVIRCEGPLEDVRARVADVWRAIVREEKS